MIVPTSSGYLKIVHYSGVVGLYLRVYFGQTMIEEAVWHDRDGWSHILYEAHGQEDANQVYKLIQEDPDTFLLMARL